MRRRVAFAGAILHTPDLLFLDEPFESVDPAGVALMKRWLRAYTAAGRALCLSTHMLDTVERLCDRVAIIAAGGRLLWTGDLSPFRDGQPVSVDGRAFATLEALYLARSGQRHTDVDWLTPGPDRD